ncbi:ferrochelatase [Candidatus Pelagibacter communis]|uniref:ferrochelatase n=1 Tax=Pelagibacter ubique TaxID=198252 RepID=UPI00094CBB6B|nr:ferrochelatase [Candidatus Pelagibacter ubique]|tara:strand:- start:1463 stop:2497 length:1035 start_codon:yes stop_codon:yes gene_type:complete
MKKAIILFNLGGPDKLQNVEPFLFNLFNDPAILNLPGFLRYPLAKFIANRRAPTAKKIYEELGGSSPILKLTKKQSSALEVKLNSDDKSSEYKCFIVMRCWHPRAEIVIKDVIEFNPKEVILVPLYPQYSAATSGSSIKEWNDVCKKVGYKIKTSTICCYPTDESFIEAHKIEITKKIDNLKNFKLIFSAHGLPEKNIKKGDPYQWQVEQSVNKIVESLNIKNLDWILSYQSRVGPLKWIGPSTEDIIVENSKLGKHIVLVPIAFVSEHSETLVELDIEYKELADKNGCKNYSRVPALGTNEKYIKALSDLIINKENYSYKGELFPPKTQCPKQFKKCPCLNYE